MQLPPLTFTDVTLLLAVGAVILIITVELCSPYNGLTNLVLNKRKLRSVALALSFIFFITIAIRTLAIIIKI